MSTIVKESCISLSGSIEIVVEYFGDSVCSILDQRGIYPRKYFKRMEKYGIPIFVADDAALKDFLKKYMEQVKRWLEKCDMRKLVLVILSQHTNEPLERWIFDVSLENDENSPNTNKMGGKDIKTIKKEIQTIIRQITASVTCLPLLSCPVKFDLLAYTSGGAEVPADWEESDGMNIENAEQISFQTLSTSIHKVNTVVQYKVDSL